MTKKRFRAQDEISRQFHIEKEKISASKLLNEKTYLADLEKARELYNHKISSIANIQMNFDEIRSMIQSSLSTRCLAPELYEMLLFNVNAFEDELCDIFTATYENELLMKNNHTQASAIAENLKNTVKIVLSPALEKDKKNAISDFRSIATNHAKSSILAFTIGLTLTVVATACLITALILFAPVSLIAAATTGLLVANALGFSGWGHNLYNTIHPARGNKVCESLVKASANMHSLFHKRPEKMTVTRLSEEHHLFNKSSAQVA